MPRRTAFDRYQYTSTTILRHIEARRFGQTTRRRGARRFDEDPEPQRRPRWTEAQARAYVLRRLRETDIGVEMPILDLNALARHLLRMEYLELRAHLEDLEPEIFSDGQPETPEDSESDPESEAEEPARPHWRDIIKTGKDIFTDVNLQAQEHLLREDGEGQVIVQYECCSWRGQILFRLLYGEFTNDDLNNFLDRWSWGEFKRIDQAGANMFSLVSEPLAGFHAATGAMACFNQFMNPIVMRNNRFPEYSRMPDPYYKDPQPGDDNYNHQLKQDLEWLLINYPWLLLRAIALRVHRPYWIRHAVEWLKAPNTPWQIPEMLSDFEKLIEGTFRAAGYYDSDDNDISANLGVYRQYEEAHRSGVRTPPNPRREPQDRR